MELILDIILEKRRPNIQWKQLVCAVLLAFLTAGLYNYTSAQTKHHEEFMKARMVPAASLEAAGTAAKLAALPEENTEAAAVARPESEPETKAAAAADESNYAVSYGGSETKTENRTKNAAVSGNRTKSVVKAKRFTKRRTGGSKTYVTETAPAVPVAGIFTGKTDTDSSAADDKNTGSADKTDTNPVTVWERFPGFLVNEKGHITGYTDASKFLKDHLVVFPVHAGCSGIEEDALKGLETEIFEIYIPENITYIANGAFDDLVNLYYIEASPKNGRFYSENGILYYRNGEIAACPRRLRAE